MTSTETQAVVAEGRIEKVLMANGQPTQVQNGVSDQPDMPDVPQQAALESETIQNEYELVETRILREFC